MTWTFDGLVRSPNDSNDTPNDVDAGLWDSSSSLVMDVDVLHHRQELWCNASVSMGDAEASTYIVLFVNGRNMLYFNT